MKPTLDLLKQGRAALHQGKSRIITTATGQRYAIGSDGNRLELPMEPCIGSESTVDTAKWHAALSAPTTVRSPNTLRIVTWNVWFDQMANGCRFEALVGSFLEHNPDVVCLQEVTRDFSQALHASTILSDKYEYSPFPVDPYGCMILARRGLDSSFQQVSLPTRMHRSLLLCVFDHGESVVATVHLESLGNESMRKSQLRTSGEALAPFRNAILCGDFNFHDTQHYGAWRSSKISTTPLENLVLSVELPDFLDMWPLLHPNERGATFDGPTNPVCILDHKEVMRYDRIMMKSNVWMGQEMNVETRCG
ncbi:hypothetical protein LEN26_008792 [Aphanomyces euteiches]|nr:hypothetical protein AeMF1_019041 [Aphanomyces euteiches]KAH9130160.1 hypothetical protein LEN26_008792 [Aphanomyces euteiches]KAH9189564.1 hypothetical protein AeNC1_008462 [Aphanomyces euteiches]